MTADIGSRVIKKVDVKEIKFRPGQQTGLHKHPCPVISYIVSGTILFQVEGDILKTLKAGDVAFEPWLAAFSRYDCHIDTGMIMRLLVRFVYNYNQQRKKL